jgi:hypothetical protein
VFAKGDEIVAFSFALAPPAKAKRAVSARRVVDANKTEPASSKPGADDDNDAASDDETDRDRSGARAARHGRRRIKVRVLCVCISCWCVRTFTWALRLTRC